jgi:O-antigen/teichoic acid export membrane protein
VVALARFQDFGEDRSGGNEGIGGGLTAREHISDSVAEGATTEFESVKPLLTTRSGRQSSLLHRTLSPSSALHQTALSLADQGIASATNFLTGVIIARACSKEELGLYMLGFSVILFMTDLQTSLITTPYMVYSPRLKERAHALYTGSTLIHQSAFCLITMIGVTCGAAIVSHGIGPRGLGPVLWALVLVIALIMLREHARRVSFARLMLKTAFIFDTSIAVCQIGGLLLLAHFGLLSASRAYWIVGAICGVAVLVWLWWDNEYYEPQLKESLTDLKKNWAFGKWVFASGLVWTISMNLYPWLLAFFHGTASAGVWAACVGVVSIGNTALLGIQNLVGPKIAHKYAAEGPGALRRLVLTISIAVALPISVLCIVLTRWGDGIISLLYGRQYAGNGLVVSILAWNLLVTAIAFSFSRALFAIERAEMDFLGNAAAFCIMISLGLWLVRSFGPLGGAIGLLSANIAGSTVRAGTFLRVSIPFRNTRETRFSDL